MPAISWWPICNNEEAARDFTEYQQLAAAAHSRPTTGIFSPEHQANRRHTKMVTSARPNNRTLCPIRATVPIINLLLWTRSAEAGGRVARRGTIPTSL